jgi:hypothetical protein
LLALFAFGAIGTLTELVLLDHLEEWQQWIPVVLLAAGGGLGGWAVLRPQPGSVVVRMLGWLSVGYVLAGAVGVWLHYAGNVEFEREMSPDSAGWTMVREALTGATPALAPGTMVWFGVLGVLAVRWAHATPRRESP